MPTRLLTRTFVVLAFLSSGALAQEAAPDEPKPLTRGGTAAKAVTRGDTAAKAATRSDGTAKPVGRADSTPKPVPRSDAAAKPTTRTDSAARAAARPDILVVGPQGQPKKAPTDMQVELRTEVLHRDEGVGDLLRRNGLNEDAKTVDMLKRMNPGHDFSSGTLRAGTKVDLFVPKPGDNRPAVDHDAGRVTFSNPAVAKLAAVDRMKRADDVRNAAYALPPTAFANAKDLATHRQSVTHIETAARLFHTKADALAPPDFAVAKYQIDYATRLAAAVNEQAQRTGKIASADVRAASAAAASTQPMTIRLMSGQSPLPLRRVKVRVLKQDSDDDVRGLQVYLLPAGLIDRPDLFAFDEVLTYLTRFSFIDETSPSSQNIPVFDARVWVGPKLKFSEMAAAVKARQLTKFRPINDPDLGSPVVELVFRAPADVMAP
jgi:hypothetical protein